MNIRVSVTKVDSYQYFLDNDHIDEWSRECVMDVLGLRPETEAMKWGKAIHSVVLDPINHALDDGIQMDSKVDVEMARPQLVEVPVTKEYRVMGHDVTLSGRIDGVAGSRLLELKTTTGQIDFDKYAYAFQWRAYLDMYPRADRVRYDVLKYTTPNKRVNAVGVSSHAWYEFPRYSQVNADVHRGVERYVQFLIELHQQDIVSFDDMGRPIEGEGLVAWLGRQRDVKADDIPF